MFSPPYVPAAIRHVLFFAPSHKMKPLFRCKILLPQNRARLARNDIDSLVFRQLVS